VQVEGDGVRVPGVAAEPEERRAGPRAAARRRDPHADEAFAVGRAHLEALR
jgi:hypothetical protein